MQCTIIYCFTFSIFNSDFISLFVCLFLVVVEEEGDILEEVGVMAAVTGIVVTAVEMVATSHREAMGEEIVAMEAETATVVVVVEETAMVEEAGIATVAETATVVEEEEIVMGGEIATAAGVEAAAMAEDMVEDIAAAEEGDEIATEVVEGTATAAAAAVVTENHTEIAAEVHHLEEAAG